MTVSSFYFFCILFLERMSLNQIIYHYSGDTIDDTLNLKANTIEVKGNINVPFINGMPYIGGAVNVGQPFDLLQTNSAGTAPEWTNDIFINDIEINGDIYLNSLPGLTNQTIVKSVSGPVWGSPTISLSSIPPGTNNTVLITDNTGTVDWSRDIDVDTINVDGQIEILNNPGTDGQVIIKAGGLPTWGTPSFTLPSIPVGTPRQILQTNAAGTQAQWTSDIKVDNADIVTNLSFNGSSGSSGNVPIKVGSSQVWGKINPTSVAAGSADSVLFSDGVNVSWTNDNLTLANPKVTGSLRLNGNGGFDGQFIKKFGSTQNWTYIDAPDLSHGLANQVVVTNGSGTASEWNYVSEESIQPRFGTAKHVLTVNNTNTGTLWSLVNPDSIAPGAADQVLVTNNLGEVEWANPISPITVGSSYELLQTNVTGTAVEWTNIIRPVQVIFNGANNNAFRRYYASGYTTLPIFAYDTVNGNIINLLQTVPVQYVVVGQTISLIVSPFSILTNGSLVNGRSYNILISLNAPAMSPSALFSPSNARQTTGNYYYSNYVTTPELGFYGVYRQYYGYTDSYLEFSKTIVYNSPGNYNHGEPFVYSPFTPGYFFTLQAPITVNYLVDF